MVERNNIEEDWDYLFSPSRWTVRMGPGEALEDYLSISSKAREKLLLSPILETELDIAYCTEGDTTCCVDIYKPKNAPTDAPICLFVHGGYWQELSKIYGAIPTLALAKDGVITVAVGYTIAPKGTLSQMVEEVKRSVIFVAKKFPDTRGIYVGGHSAGGHLAAMLLAEDWTQYNIPQNVIKGMLLVSGIFDVVPIVKTYVNDPLKLDETEAMRLSPMCHIKEACLHSKHCKVIVSVAEHDSPPFRTQSREYAKLLKDGGFDVKFIDIQGKDHYDIASDLVLEDNLLILELLKLVNDI